ncbi:MAG: hypothetical protein ABIG71_00375 [Candidatus Uhrbacteria bacterium]
MKRRLVGIGLLQAIGVVVYTVGFGLLMKSLGSFANEPDQIVGVAFMLTLLVFSAAVSGALVFGYGAYLISQHRTHDAITVIGATIGSLALLLVLGVVAIAVFA